MYFRAFHAVPTRGPDGAPTGAVHGFLDALGRLLRDHRPDRLVACLDADWRPAFRVAALPSYKAHRVDPTNPAAELIPAALLPQVPVLLEVLAAAGIVAAGCPGYEADDVIATLASRAAPASTDIVTGDRDLFQLVGDERPVRVLYTGAGGLRVVDEAEVTRRYAIPGTSYADFALLRGDPSDGLPGVAGIGQKTAATLINRFGDLAGIRAAAHAPAPVGFPPGAAQRIRDSADYLDRAGVVVRTVSTAPLPTPNASLPPRPAEPDRLAALSARYGLAGPIQRLGNALGWQNETHG